jgi:tetratricopeptide (TPR) repeat protein
MKPKYTVLLAVCCIVTLPLFAQYPPTSPENPAELVKRGQELNNAGKQDEALALYRQAIAANPKSLDAHLAAGVSLDLQGKYEEARRYLAKAIELASAETKDRALRTMAVSYAFEGRGSDAAGYEKQVFDARLAKSDFVAAAEIANELGRIFLESGSLNDAQQWYKAGYDTALRKKDLTEADKNLWLFRWEHAQGRIAARRGQGDEAQQHIHSAKLALDKANNPDQARFFPYLVGYVAFYSGDAKTALSEFQKADQRDPFILCLMAQSYEKLGDQATAAENYRKVMAINTHSPANAFARPVARKKLQ